MSGADAEVGASQAVVISAGSGSSEVDLLQKKDGEEKSHSSGVTSWFLSWRFIGPGLLVCLADTDAGCLIVAAQSGARWGYSLLLLQVALIPILFLAQELTIRLGVHTRKGHTACIREHFGVAWAWFACALLVLECVCAMISEMSGVAAVGELWGLGRFAATLISAGLLVAVIFFCSYRQVETIGVIFGLFELTFVLTMFCFHPSPSEVFKGSFTFYSDGEYFKLITANIGAVVMPWMIYFQQNAVVARRLVTSKDLAEERIHTLLGSILTQLVMIGMLVTMAAAHEINKNLHTVHDIATAMEPVLGSMGSKVLVSLGFLGGSICAAFVVSLASSWAICEASGWDVAHSLDESPTQAPEFYGCFLGVVVIGILVLNTGVNVVKLNVLVELMDGILLPFAVGFLFLLATGNALPPEVRVVGFHKYVLAFIFALCTALSIVSAIFGVMGG
mmetsp:Transcript_11580/g.24414  ORF Transcript_11580/g.24414 Transcript_11580/m.24414 type:complete len:448 (-) Transcript_11580:65-1408(-)